MSVRIKMRSGVFGVVEEGQDAAWFNAGTGARLGSVCKGLAQGMDPARFSACP